jgi:hypothetical protein
MHFQSNNPVFETTYLRIDTGYTTISFNKKDMVAHIRPYGEGVILTTIVSFTHVKDTIFLLKEDKQFLAKYKIINKNVLFDIDNEVYAINLKLYNKRFKNRLLVVNNNKHKMKKGRFLPMKKNMQYLNRKEATKKYGVDGINGALIIK